MSARLVRYRNDLADPDTVVVRVVRDGDATKAFVGTIDYDDETTPFYATEEVSVPEAIRLASNRRRPDEPILVRLEEGTEWNPEWGTLE